MDEIIAQDVRVQLCNTAHFCVSDVTEITGWMAKIQSGPNELGLKTPAGFVSRWGR